MHMGPVLYLLVSVPPDSMILLGSIQRYELERMLLVQLSHESHVYVDEVEQPPPQVPVSASASPPPPPTTMVTLVPPPAVPQPRFQVTKVDEESGGEVEDLAGKLPQPLNAPSLLRVVSLLLGEREREHVCLVF